MCSHYRGWLLAGLLLLFGHLGSLFAEGLAGRCGKSPSFVCGHGVKLDSPGGGGGGFHDLALFGGHGGNDSAGGGKPGPSFFSSRFLVTESVRFTTCPYLASRPLQETHDGGVSDTEPCGEITSRRSIEVELDRDFFIYRISGTVHTPLRHHVGHVVLLGSEEEVAWSHARRNVAVVTDAHFVWNRPVGQRPGNAVGLLHFPGPVSSTSDTDLSVSVTVLESSPHPAITRLVDLLPEALSDRSHFSSHGRVVPRKQGSSKGGLS